MIVSKRRNYLLESTCLKSFGWWPVPAVLAVRGQLRNIAVSSRLACSIEGDSVSKTKQFCSVSF